jgi:hypothetical protein
VASVAVGTLFALGLLRAAGGALGLLLALLSAGGGLAVARLPVAGRPLEAWLPTLGRFSALAIEDGRLPWRPSQRPGRAGTLSRLEVKEVLAGKGALFDAEAGTISLVFPVGGDGFPLMDEDGQAASISGWASALETVAGEASGLYRLQWIVRSRPAGRLWYLDEPSGESGAAPSSYRGLLATALESLCEREVFVVLTSRMGHVRFGKPARLADEEHELAGRLLSLCLSLGARLSSLGLQVGEPLGLTDLCAVIRRAYEDPTAEGIGSWPFPLGVEASWSSLRTDATWQVTYWVAEWPRSDVGPSVLLPLLLGGADRQTVSLTLAPLPATSAVRRAERERTSVASDAELRRRHGFSLTARARAEEQVALSREAELAAGHAGFLFSGYVAVTAKSKDELETSCAALEQAAALSQLELRRLYGAQEEAWCCTLPTGRGCR